MSFRITMPLSCLLKAIVYNYIFLVLARLFTASLLKCYYFSKVILFNDDSSNIHDWVLSEAWCAWLNLKKNCMTSNLVWFFNLFNWYSVIAI